MDCFFCHAPASARRLIKNLLTYLLTIRYHCVNLRILIIFGSHLPIFLRTYLPTNTYVYIYIYERQQRCHIYNYYDINAIFKSENKIIFPRFTFHYSIYLPITARQSNQSFNPSVCSHLDSADMSSSTIPPHCCSIPYTYQGIVYYNCTTNVTKATDIGCYVANWIWKTCSYTIPGE